MMGLAQDRLLGKIVRLSYSKSCASFFFSLFVCNRAKELQILILLVMCCTQSSSYIQRSLQEGEQHSGQNYYSKLSFAYDSLLSSQIACEQFQLRDFYFVIVLQVMCDAYTPAGEPIPTNNRHKAAKIFSHPDVVAEVPW